jgi:hypothetical protein
MPKINGIAVATVRDLREFLSLVEALHGPEVIPYFWDDLDDKQFIPLRQITESSVERKMPPTTCSWRSKPTIQIRTASAEVH